VNHGIESLFSLLFSVLSVLTLFDAEPARGCGQAIRLHLRVILSPQGALMRKYWPAVIAASFSLSTLAIAQDAPQGGAKTAMAEVSVGTAVADRTLSGAAESFPAGTERLYCFARISNAEGSDIEFVWYKGDSEQARVKQTVKYSPHRTWSSKTLAADAAGDWRCDVVQGEKVLQSVKFKVE